MEDVRKKLKIERMIVVDCDGEGRKRRGGLVLCWQFELDIQVISWSKNHIDVIVCEADGFEWRFTGIYGFPEEDNKVKTGVLLETLVMANNLPWICGGDFNLMLMAHEKKRGDGFKKKISGSFVSHLPKKKSDHVPLILSVRGGQERTERRWNSKRFRFEAMWLRENESENVVVNAWNKGEDASINLMRTTNKLAVWSKHTFGNTAKEICKCQQQMKELMEQDPTAERMECMRNIDARMEELENREESYWRQRSRQN